MQKKVRNICTCGILKQLRFESANDDKGLPEKVILTEMYLNIPCY